MINFIEKAVKISSIFTSKISPDASRAKIIFEDTTNVKGFNSKLLISAFRRGIIVNLNINDFQILIEMTENISIPIEVPSPIGLVGGVISLSDLVTQKNKMNANFNVDLQLGLFGTFNLFNQHISYIDDEGVNSDDQSLIHDINEVKFYALIELIKADNDINENEISFFNDFLEKTNLTSERKDFFISIFKNKEPLKIDYSVLENSAYAKPLLLVLIELASKDGEISFKEFQFIKKYANQVAMEDIDELKEISKLFKIEDDLIYIYKGNPGATYKKNDQGKWLISSENTNGYVLINDPEGNRSELLNLHAVLK